MIAIATAIVVVLAALTGCSGGPKLGTCARVETSHTIVHVSGDLGGPITCTVRADFTIDLGLEVPEGTTLEVHGAAWSPTAPGNYRLDLVPALMALPPGAVRARDLGYTIAVTVKRPGEDVVVQTVAIEGSQSIWSDLLAHAVEGRDLGLGKGPRATPPTVVLADGTFAPSFVGKPARIGDVDFIALQKDVSGPAMSCTYQQQGSQRRFGPSVVPVSVDVVIYDARTAREVTRKRFDPVDLKCPATAKPGAQIPVGVKTREIIPWLETWRSSPDATR